MAVTGILFFFAFLALLILALVRNPLYGLYSYIAVFYLHPPSRWWGESLPDLRWSFTAAVVTFLAIMLRNPPRVVAPIWSKTTPAIIMMIFIAWFWVGYSWALDKEQHFPAAILITKYLLVFYMVYRLIDTPTKGLQFLAAHLIGCSYLGYLGFTTHTGGRLDGVGGPGLDDSNTLGMYAATGVLCGAVISLILRKMRLVMCIVAIGFALNVVFLAASRGAILGLLVGGIFVAALYPTVYKARFKTYAILAFIMVGMLASQQLIERMESITAVTSENPNDLDNSARSRIVLAQAQLQMSKLYPLGTGHRGTEFLSASYLDARYLTRDGGRSSHNAFLTVLVEQGIPGALMFIMMCIWVLRQMLFAMASRKQLARRPDDTDSIYRQAVVAAVCACLVTILVSGMFADFSKCEVQIWLFAILASMSVRKVAIPINSGKVAARN